MCMYYLITRSKNPGSHEDLACMLARCRAVAPAAPPMKSIRFIEHAATPAALSGAGFLGSAAALAAREKERAWEGLSQPARQCGGKIEVKGGRC